ncbi:MAG: FecR domain-containing protein [Methylophilaceae bacterium]
MKKIIFYALAISTLLTAQLVFAVPAGKIILSTGDVTIRDAVGKQRAASAGMTLESGESVITQQGRTQIKFSDGGLISLQPSTEFKVESYQFEKNNREADDASFNLIKGGLRALTGLVGKERREAYQMKNPTSTIGIRGTEFQALMCSASCKEPDGLYVHTGEGRIVVKNAVGEIDVGAGQSAYVASANDAPQSTSNTAVINAEESKKEKIPGVGDNSEFRSGDILGTPSLGQLTTLSSAGVAFAGSGSLTANGKLFSGSGAVAGAGTNNSSATVGVYISGNQITAATVNYNNQLVTVTPASVQGAAADGGLYWGRWTNTTFNVYAGLNTAIYKESVAMDANSSIHYLLGTSVPTIPGTGTATYSFIGGTASTDATGMVGSGITAGTLTANFSGYSVGANLTINHGGVYNLTATMPMSSNPASFSTSNIGGSASTTGAGNYSANVSGFFSGTNAPTAPSRAGISYEIKAPSSIVGVGAFGCSSGC